MMSTLCDLASESNIWCCHVMSFLSLKEIVRLDTAILIRRCRLNLFRSWRDLPPVFYPYLISFSGTTKALEWLFRRGVTFRSLSLPLEYLASNSLQTLVVQNFNALVGEFRISCFAELTMLISGTDIHPALASKVTDLAISVRYDRAQQSTLGAGAAVIPVTILRQPFSNLKRLPGTQLGLTDNMFCLC